MSQAWVFVDAGKKGTEKQCIGLAKALQCTVDIVSVSFPAFIQWLPAPLLSFLASYFIKDLPLSSPTYIISGGRQAASMAVAVKKNHPSCQSIHILNPYGLEKKFNWVIVPEHDQRHGPNTLTMLGALHDLSDSKLEEAKKVWGPFFAALRPPYTTVLIGGKNKTHTFTRVQLDELLGFLKTFQDGSLLISLSRRTPSSFLPLIQQALERRSHFLWYEGCGHPNPYEGLLALADRFVLTSDSISMVTEVAFTGKPIHLFYLPTSSKKFQRFYHTLEKRGLLLNDSYTPLDETSRIASYLQRKIFL